MWELDRKEGRALKNWCFWTAMPEKTLESPLESKESKPVNPKGNQPEHSLEALMLKLTLQGYLMQRADSLKKTLILGKIEGRRRRGWQRTRWLGVITNSWSLLTLMSIQMVVPSSHLILCGPLLLPPSIFPSIRVFSKESALHIRWPKYWSFSFGISPSDEYSGLISSRIDWFVLLAVKGTLKSLVQHGSSEA